MSDQIKREVERCDRSDNAAREAPHQADPFLAAGSPVQIYYRAADSLGFLGRSSENTDRTHHLGAGILDGLSRLHRDRISKPPEILLDTVGDLPVILLEIDPGVLANDPTDDTVQKAYLWANGQILAQYDGDWRNNVNKYFYLHDRLGSVRQVIDTTGSVVAEYT